MEKKIYEKQIKEQVRLPPINLGKITGQERYKSNGSRDELKQNIDKIEGRTTMQKGPSTQKIYATKTKVK